jgi:hypothetical protein
MKSSYRKYVVIIILGGLLHFSSEAQVNVPKYEIGVGVGTFIYQGDLTPEPVGSFRTMTPAINLYGSKILNRSFSVRANLAFGLLRGDDAAYGHPEYRQHRNFNFSSPVVELSGLLVWNPLRKNYADKGFSPYLFGGAGVGFLNVKRDWSNYDAAYFGGDGSDIPERIAIDAAHGTPHIIPVIPAGAGLRYNISSRWAVNTEAAYRFVFTDYLDGFSQSADPTANDAYHSITIGIIYRIGKKNTLDCPPVTY